MKNLLCSLLVLLVVGGPAFGVSADEGDYIGIVSPASFVNKDVFQAAVSFLESHDYRVKIGAHALDEYGYLAGTDQHRADDINAMFMDDSVKAVLCTRGGYGTARILGRLDYEMISAHPKPLIGYSDITALHIVLNEKCGIPTIHGPMLASLVTDPLSSDYTVSGFLRMLEGSPLSGEITMPEGRELKTIIPGRAEGKILGGSLTLIASLAGTPYELKADGALLLIEEVGEKPYRIDRMLNQLWQNGLLSRVNGILFGDFVNCASPENAGDTFTLEDILKHYAELSGKPAIYGIPAGHGADNMCVPLGVQAVMKANDDGTASLRINQGGGI